MNDQVNELPQVTPGPAVGTVGPIETPLPASLEQSNVNGPAAGVIARQDFDPVAFEAARAASERKYQRIQIASLVLASNLGPNLAVAADQAVTAADALLDRLSRD